MRNAIGWMVGLVGALVALAPRDAAATQGHKIIKSNLTLTETHMGNITIDADNVVLDCQGNQVHSSSAAGLNCVSNTKKCGIAAEGHKNVVVKNCYVVGGDFFTHGVWFKNMSQSGIFSSLVSNPKSHGYVIQGGGPFPSGLFFLKATNIGSTSGIGFLIDGVNGLVGRGLEHAGNSHGTGLEIKGSQNITLDDADMTPEQASPGGIGVHIVGSSDITMREITANSFRMVDYSTAGMSIENSTRLTITGALISNNETHGLRLQNTTLGIFTNVVVTATEDSCDTSIEGASAFNSFNNCALGLCCGNCP